MTSIVPPPNKAQPWRLSDTLYRRVSRAAKEEGLGYRKCIVLPSDSDFDFVWNSFHSNKPSRYGIRRIFVIYQTEHNESFEIELSNQEAQSKDPLFSPNWMVEHPIEQRKKVIERWRGFSNRYTNLSLKKRTETLVKTSVFPLWHGFQAEGKGVSICNTGFEIPGKHNVHLGIERGIVTDPGFFGSGIYFAREAKYAVDVYSKKSGHVLLAWVSMREPYPVTREDFDKKKLEGKGHVGFYNAHYIPVISKDPFNTNEVIYYPVRLDEAPQYDEIVVFQKSQTLPRFWVELQPDLPFEPSTYPSSNGALVDFIFKILEQSLIQNDGELRDLLKEKSRVLLIHGEKSFLPPSEDEFYIKICELFKTQGQIDLLARDYLLELEKNPSQHQQLLPDTFASIKSYLERGHFQDAWEDLCLAGHTLFENFDPLNSPVYDLIIRVLPNITWEKKTLLFDKIITPLRTLGSTNYLELALGRWFSQGEHEEILKEEWWHQELKIPALACYGKALALSNFEVDKKPIYREVSLLLAKSIFDNLPLLGQSIDNAIGKQDVNSLKKSLQLLSKIRKYFCLNKEEREKLVPLYSKMKGFLHQVALPSSEAFLLREGVKPESGPFPLPYAQICAEALSSWKTTFEKQEELTLFSDLLKAICPKLEEKSIESFFSFLIPSRETERFFSPPFLLKRFLEAKRGGQENLSLLEIGFHRASLEEESFSYLTPLIESAAGYLLSKNSPDEEVIRLYKMLSAGPNDAPFREVFARSFSETKKALFIQMASIRDRSGSRLSTLFEKQALIEQISMITQQEPSTIAIQGPFETTCYLKSSLVERLIDAQGDIKKSYKDSLHLVSRLQEEGVDLHFKQKPSHPLLEYAIYSLASKLYGRGVPTSQLVRFEVTLPGLSTKIYPVLISQTIEGRNLSDVLKEDPSFCPDQQQLTEMVLLGLLTRPGDGRASNFILTTKNELYSVDNDVSFVEPIVKELKGETVNFCSVLHYFSSDLDLTVVEDWKTLSPSLLFTSWLEDLADRERYHLSLFSEMERKALYEEDKNLKFVPQLILKAGTITTVFTQFHHLLSLNTSTNLLNLLRKLITLNDTGSLNQTGDRLYLAYARGTGSPSERLKMATHGKKERSMTTPQAFKASIGKVPTLEEIEKRELFSLEKVKNEFLAYALIKQGGVTFRGTEGKQALEVDFSKIQKGGKPDLEREKLVLKGLSLLVDKNPPQIFIIKNSSTLTVEKLKSFLHKKLVHLEIHNCISLVKIGDLGLGILPDSPLDLPSDLKIVEFFYCTSLTSIQIQAPQVELVKITGSPKLASLILNIHLFGKIRVLDLPDEIIDKMLEKTISQKLIPYEKILTNSEPIRNLIAFEKAVLKKGERSQASLILNLVEKKQGKVLTSTIPKERPDLSSLSLGNMGAGIKEVRIIADILQDFQIRTLDLQANQINAECAKALAASLPQSHVTHLNLYWNRIGGEGAKAIAISLPKSKLANLNLEENYIGDEGAKALATSLPNSQLTNLDLRRVGISAEGIKAIAFSLPKSQLTNLNLQENLIGIDGAKALADSLPKSQLTNLNLQGNWFSAIHSEGAKAIAESLPKSQITNLNLRWNHIDSGGAKGLAKSLSTSQLTNLNLQENQIGDEGATSIAEALPKSQLINLNLKENQIGDQGAVDLAESISKSRLTNLDLARNQISDQGAKALAISLGKSQLISLHLGQNQIGDKGAKLLAVSLTNSRLTKLNLRQNQIGLEGAKAIAALIPKSQLTKLNLSRNQIGSEGAKAIVSSISESQITSLNLQENGIDNQGAELLNKLRNRNGIEIEVRF